MANLMRRPILLLVLSVGTIALVYWASVWYTGGNYTSGGKWMFGSEWPSKFGAIPRPAIEKRQQLLDFIKEEETGPISGQETSTGGFIPRPSRLLYLTQTESCLPSKLLSADVIGNTSACQCDVLVLSYKKKCTKNPYEHVEYVFNSNTSWASGRNFVYERAKKRGKVYLFYIFMDDDMELSTKTKNSNPWREFEDFLKQVEPAVAAIDIDTNRMLQHIFNGRKQKRCTLNQMTLMHMHYSCITTARFDPAMNAYHHEAAEYILPYTTIYDNTSWWFPDLHFEIKCELMFAGQTVMHTSVTGTNPKHRRYPRGNPSRSQWSTMVDLVTAELPEHYRNSSLLSEWKRHGLDHRLKSSTLCLSPPPPHMPIRPFAYLDNVLYTTG